MESSKKLVLVAMAMLLVIFPYAFASRGIDLPISKIPDEAKGSGYLSNIFLVGSGAPMLTVTVTFHVVGFVSFTQ